MDVLQQDQLNARIDRGSQHELKTDALVWMNYFVHDAKLKFELFSQSTYGNRMIEHIYFLSSPIHYHSFSGHNRLSRVKLTLVMKIALEPSATSNSLAPLHSLVQQVPAYLAQITFWGHYFYAFWRREHYFCVVFETRKCLAIGTTAWVSWLC